MRPPDAVHYGDASIACRPRVSPQQSRTTPNGALKRRPHGRFFSRAIKAPKTSIHPVPDPDSEHQQHQRPAASGLPPPDQFVRMPRRAVLDNTATAVTPPCPAGRLDRGASGPDLPHPGLARPGPSPAWSSPMPGSTQTSAPYRALLLPRPARERHAAPGGTDRTWGSLIFLGVRLLCGLERLRG